MYKKLIVSAFLIAYLFISCENTFNENKPAVKIGDISYTQEEYKILLHKHLKNKGINHNKIASKLIDNWQKALVEHSLLLAEAIENGIQKDKAIEEKVQKVSKQMILQNGGLLYERSISENINVTDSELDEAIELFKFEYQIEYIVFISVEAIERVLGNDTVISYDKFNRLVNLSKHSPDLYYNKLKWNWISGTFIGARHQIYSLAEGDISSFIKTAQGIVLVRVNKKDRILEEHLKYYNKDRIRSLLTRLEGQIMAEKLDMKFYNMSKLKIDYETASKVWEILKNDEGTKIAEHSLYALLNHQIVNYESDSGKISVTVKDFINYYNALMIKKEINTKQLLYYYLKEIPWEDQALKYAEDLGITKDKEFLIDQSYFRNKTIVDEFIRYKYKNQLQISENEIEKEYMKNKQNYNQGEYAIVTLFYFDSQQEAWKGSNELKNGKWLASDSIFTQIQGLKKCQLHNKVHYEDKSLSDNIINKLFQIGDEKYLPPQKLGNDFVVARKEGIEGERLIPLKEVYSYIKNKIFAQRYTNLKDNLIDSLKYKYNIKTNFPEV